MVNPTIEDSTSSMDVPLSQPIPVRPQVPLRTLANKVPPDTKIRLISLKPPLLE